MVCLFFFFRLLHPHRRLPNPAAFWLVGLQEVFPGVAVKASLAEVFALPVLALVILEAVEVFNTGVVELACLFYQEQVDAG